MVKGSQSSNFTDRGSERTWMTRARAMYLKNEWMRGYSLLSPTLITMIFLLAIPIIMLVTYSFWTQNYVYLDKSFTLNNYLLFFEKWIYGKLLWRSIKLSVMVTLITILLAYPVAYFLAFRVKKNVMSWLILINIPFVTSYLLRILAWKIMLGTNGIINSSLMNIGIIQAPLEYLLYSRFAVILTLAHSWAAFAILPIYVSLQKIDRSLLEAATDLGDGPIKRFLRITLPLSMPGLIAATIIQFIPTVGDYLTPVMVGGTKGMMFGQIIAAQFGVAMNWPLGAALTIIMGATITAIVSTFIWFSKRGTVKVKDMETTSQKGSIFDEGSSYGPLFIYVVIYVLFLYIPSAMLPIFSFNDSTHMVLPLKGFTTQWYEQLWELPGLFTALGNSLRVAVPVAITTVILATFAAKAMTRYRLPGRSLALGFILLPFVMPGIILVFGLFLLAMSVGVQLSLWTIRISHIVFTVPYATLILMARLDGVSKNIEEASLDLGMNGFQTFWRVTFPLILPG